MTDEASRQHQIDAWWAEREQQYRNRPEIRRQADEIRASIQRQREEEDARIQHLEQLVEAGVPEANLALDEAYTMQALHTDPPEPSAKDDPEEWSGFFQEHYGRDMPLNAAFQAENHRIEAAAPADVGGMAAAYFEAHDPSFDPVELAAERLGVPVADLYGEPCAEELQAE